VSSYRFPVSGSSRTVENEVENTIHLLALGVALFLPQLFEFRVGVQSADTELKTPKAAPVMKDLMKYPNQWLFSTISRLQ
jgi:hypothetical protein